MKISNVDLNDRVLIVAEIGNNHEGDLDLACRMISLAATAGADAVKFQTIVPEKLISSQQKERLAQLQRFALSQEQFVTLSQVAASEGVMFLSTPFDLESVAFLEHLVPAFKIASGDNNFYPLIQTIAKTRKPVLLSSGLADLEDVKKAKTYIEGIWKEEGVAQQLAVLHCVVNYPTAVKNANLAAIRDLESLGVTPGYSDHTIGVGAAALAVAVGARIIEKHFTHDKNHSEFRDHKLSVDPKEMKEMVRRIREAELMLGDGSKKMLPCEEPMREPVRRSIAASRDLGKGTVLEFRDLTWLRPGIGFPPGEEASLIGSVLTRRKRAGETILQEDIRKGS